MVIGDVGQDAARGGRLRHQPRRRAGRRRRARTTAGTAARASSPTAPAEPATRRAAASPNPSSTTHTPNPAAARPTAARSPAATSSATASLGDLYGRYVYADFCSGGIRSLELPGDGAGGPRRADDSTRGAAVANPVSFGEDSCHRVYVVSGDGTVYRIVGDERRTRSDREPAAGARDRRRLRSARRRRSPTLGLRAKRQGAQGRLQLGVALRRPRRRRVAAQPRRQAGRAEAASTVDCTARFILRVPGRASFRALLPAASDRVRSRSARVAAASAGR